MDGQSWYFNIPTLDGLNTLDVNFIKTDYLNNIPANVINYLANVTSDIQEQIDGLSRVFRGVILQPSGLTGGPNTLIATNMLGTLNLQNAQLNQNAGATINQLGRTNFKNTVTLAAGVTQSGGPNVLNDTNIGVITQPNGKYITQSGSTGVNTLRQTNISDLIVTNSITLPATVTIPSASYSGDITMNNCEIIQYDTTGTHMNQFIASDLTGPAFFDGNITQTNASKTSQLQNLTIDGSMNLVCNMSQTTGFFNALSDSTFTNITCTGDTELNTLNTADFKCRV